jgi:hypothetical protein
MWTAPLFHLRQWIKRRPHMWTDMRVAGFALRTEFGWRGRRVLISLNGPRFEQRVLRTDHVVFFEHHLPYASLPRLILDVTHGRLPSTHLPGVDFDLELFPRGQISIGGHERDARDGFIMSELERLPRFELELSGQWNERQGFNWDLRRACDRELLATSTDSLRSGSDDCKVTIAACIPARIVDLRQTADRSMVVVETAIAARIAHRAEILMTPLRAGWRDPERKLVASSDGTPFQLPDQGDVLLTLLVDGDALHSIEFHRLASVRPRLRERAVAAIEGKTSLVAEGLLQAPPKLNANLFERSVLHLFGLMGFSGFWWGPNRTRKDEKLPMPEDAADCLAFSPDDSVVALLECTVDAPGREKALKLVQRARQLKRDLQGTFDKLEVVPVLVVDCQYDDVANVVKELSSTEGLELVARDDLEELLDTVRIGGPDSEIEEQLPEQLRATIATRRLFSRLF